ncbi:MAG TPA: aminotransferase class V-fold PLP-dependent enzyme, partial [Gemmatimonadaceae bacterium]|nr:aminotransferase class V-fold PLP-dependent enzyme [Gemmatimonadaceae bacterium]
RWIAELLGYPTDCGGLLVSGGNMANFVGFLAARRRQASWDVRAEGLGGRPLRAYTSAETHTWVQKAADLFGIGTNALRWIPVDSEFRMDVAALAAAIREDRDAGALPFLVVGTAGSVSTGAIDPLPELARVAREQGLWFHVDAAYGGFAAALPDAPADLKALALADSVAVDPHKWLYAPLEAGCALVRDRDALLRAFSFHPPYYLFDGDAQDPPTNFHEWSPQNSRGFRALKVWLTMRQVGRRGYEKMIGDDIDLARELHRLASSHDELEPLTQALSITTFRYVPADLRERRDEKETGEYLNQLNTALLTKLQQDGVVYLSNAVIGPVFALRACIVNFRTTSEDIAILIDATLAAGRGLDAELRAVANR